MKVTFTIKCSAESRNELIHTFGAEYRDFRQMMEKCVADDGFARPIELRWLLDSGVWIDPPEKIEVEA